MRRNLRLVRMSMQLGCRATNRCKASMTWTGSSDALAGLGKNSCKIFR